MEDLRDCPDPVRAALAHGESAPAGALYELDRRQAYLDNAWLDWKRKHARYLKGD